MGSHDFLREDLFLQAYSWGMIIETVVVFHSIFPVVLFAETSFWPCNRKSNKASYDCMLHAKHIPKYNCTRLDKKRNTISYYTIFSLGNNHIHRNFGGKKQKHFSIKKLNSSYANCQKKIKEVQQEIVEMSDSLR